MAAQVVLLNGGSSSGKTRIVRCLQDELPNPWLAFGIDSLIEAMPGEMQHSEAGIGFAPGGGVHIGGDFRALEAAWQRGVGEMARAGARLLVDDVFLGGGESQLRWRRPLDGLAVLWVGVRCEARVASAREATRGDRLRGMAAKQAYTVHEGVVYDMEVDTTHTEAAVCARTIAAHLS
ncbi:chloramphenicol phosphotransferase CPT [Streptomyces xiaopingdaonensis]|uniref:chloramphenicol phosphotransferase CPT n=1 Tax=Streptomyces xiaopingdaonensis TaxID=1565415 RepID=UPI0002E54C45|nr:chloramphenicol phosphotransferase CPT [Streptomyces xiaopingdaonensis]